MFSNAKEGADMEAASHQRTEALTRAFPPLDRETRAAVDTETAAYHLSREPQTLRCWAAYGRGPIRPLRVHGRLAWPTADIRRLLGVAE